MHEYVPGAGPSPCEIALVGEAPGLNECLHGRPFVGEAGQELSRILQDAGLPALSRGFGADRTYNYYVTNVFKQRPSEDSNDVKLFFCPRTDPDADTTLPAHGSGRYLLRDFRPMYDDLRRELLEVQPKVVIALGGTALWALLGYSKITPYLGTVHAPAAGRPYWVIPTYHPSAILHQWSFRSTMVANLLKVEDCLKRAGLRRSTHDGGGASRFRIKINPTLAEVEAFAERAFAAPLMAVDVETAHGQIRTISFSLGPYEAFVIPFWEPPKPSYWPTLDGETRAWKAVAKALSGRGTKIFHNGPYDIQYLWRVHGIPVLGPIEDTMHAHHAMEPELPKGLAFLAATYLDLPEWKRSIRGKDSEKEED